MQHVLRAISGPQAGALYVLGDRTIIGRASDCDIQVLHEGVSRHHARITREDDGRMLLVDLSSDNGTWVEGERIERHVFGGGEVLRIMRTRLVYEQLHGTDAVTSAVFRRKVTSGDSLRQTAAGARSLAMPGAIAERSRGYSRPQSAAPAASGARPGAVSAGRSHGAETRARTQEYPALQEDVIEPSTVRRPTPTTPPRGDEPPPGRWPQLGRAPTRESAPPRGAGPETAVIRRPRTAGSMPAVGRPPLDGPSGRMAPLAPPGAEPTTTAQPIAAAPSLGSGWVRVPRPSTTPGCMRPGSTLAGVPRIDDAPPPIEPVPAPADESAPRKVTTAEYGALGSRTTTDPPTVEPAAPAVVAAPAPPEGELDAMTTVPKVRAAAARSSGTPTEEVPRILDEPDALDELDTQTRPRVTLVPQGAAPGLPYEDTLRFTRPERDGVASDPPPAEPADRQRAPQGLERLLDVVEYRELRLGALHGRRPDPAAAERCAELERALQQRRPADDDVAALRRYHRFACSIPARLTPRARAGAEPISVEIEDLSAGGAKITVREGALVTGDRVLLAVGLAEGLDEVARARLPHPQVEAVVLEGRVVWAQPHEATLGLVFAGAPRFDPAAPPA